MIEYDNEKEFNKTVDKFEPMLAFPMSKNDVTNLTTNAIVSIAISLKRIADLLTPKPPMTAEEAERVGYKFPSNQS